MNAYAGIAKANTGAELLAETPWAVQARALAELNHIARHQERRGGGNVLVASSGLTITTVLLAFVSDATYNAAVPNGIGNGAVSVLTYRHGKWTVKSMNDTSHMSAGVSAAR